MRYFQMCCFFLFFFNVFLDTFFQTLQEKNKSQFGEKNNWAIMLFANDILMIPVTICSGAALALSTNKLRLRVSHME